MILIYFLLAFSSYVSSEIFELKSPFLPSLFSITNEIIKNSDPNPQILLVERMYYIFDQDFGMNSSPIILPNNISFLPSNCSNKTFCNEYAILDVRTERFAFSLSNH